MKKKLCIGLIFAIIVQVSLVFSVFSESNVDSFTFSETDNEAIVTGCLISEGEIVIPSEYHGKPVTGIGDYAFYYNGATNITIPDSVTAIGECAFWRCYNLETVTLSQRLETIGTGAFCDCAKLEELSLPKTLKSIDEGFLTGCSSLKAVNADVESESFSSVDGILFSGDGKTLYVYPYGRAGASYTVPQETERLGDFAFFGAAVETVYISPMTKFEKTAFLKR